MTKFWKCLLSLSLAAFLLSPVMAEDAKAKKNKPNARKEQPAVQLPKEITLTDEQKTKVAELEKEYAPKMKELREKLDKVMTEEQKKARPFQFRQLMYNLVSNALKFSNPKLPSHIIIMSRIVKGSKFNNEKPALPAVRLSPDKNYCHIAVKDNGIGDRKSVV